MQKVNLILLIILCGCAPGRTVTYTVGDLFSFQAEDPRFFNNEIKKSPAINSPSEKIKIIQTEKEVNDVNCPVMYVENNEDDKSDYFVEKGQRKSLDLNANTLLLVYQRGKIEKFIVLNCN